MLAKIIEERYRVKIAQHIITGDANELEKFFLKAIEDGCEGLVCKSIAKDSVYQAGTWLVVDKVQA
jgi:DNA ligase-1